MGKNHSFPLRLLESISKDNQEIFSSCLLSIEDINMLSYIPSSLEETLDISSEFKTGLIHILTVNRRIEMIYMLQEAFESFNIDLQDENGYTSLMLSVKSSDEELASILVDMGANKTVCNVYDSGDSALHYACLTNNIRLVSSTVPDNPDLPNLQGLTPLMYAVQQNNLNIVKLLIDQGADPHFQDKENNTAVHWALLGKTCKEIADILIYSKPLHPILHVENHQGTNLEDLLHKSGYGNYLSDTNLTIMDRNSQFFKEDESILNDHRQERSPGIIKKAIGSAVDYLLLDEMSWISSKKK